MYDFSLWHALPQRSKVVTKDFIFVYTSVDNGFLSEFKQKLAGMNKRELKYQLF
jgi:hypothetical protein